MAKIARYLATFFSILFLLVTFAPTVFAVPKGVVGSPEVDLLLAVPYWIVTLIGMAMLPRLVMKFRGQLTSSNPPGPEGSMDPSKLPESLRAFQVLGARYELETQSGLVIEEKTWSETYVNVSTTPGSTQGVGNEAYYTPGSTYTSSTAVQKDRVWVRTLDGHETAWTFTGGTFPTRQGHVITGIFRRLSNGSSAFFMAYNHTTGQLQMFDAADQVDKVRKFLPWVVTTVLGTAGFIFGASKIFQALMGTAGSTAAGEVQALALAVAISGSGCFFGAASFAWIFASLARGRVGRQRGRMFESHYKPAFLRFLQQSTPALLKRLTPS